jgi:hypothetical protein
VNEELRRRVSVLVEDAQGRLLVDDLPGDVEFPGGGIEPGESVDEAAIREVMEEAGIRPSSVEAFGQWPTVADGQKTYWRKATGGNSDTSRLGADNDAMDNVQYMPKANVNAELAAPGGDPDVTEDEQLAMDKVSAYQQGYAESFKQAGIWDAVKHMGRGAREWASPVLGQTKGMVDRQTAMRDVLRARRRAKKGGGDANLAQELAIDKMTPSMQNAWREARDMGDVIQDPGSAAFNPLF